MGRGRELGIISVEAPILMGLQLEHWMLKTNSKGSDHSWFYPDFWRIKGKTWMTLKWKVYEALDYDRNLQSLDLKYFSVLGLDQWYRIGKYCRDSWSNPIKRIWTLDWTSELGLKPTPPCSFRSKAYYTGLPILLYQFPLCCPTLESKENVLLRLGSSGQYASGSLPARCSPANTDTTTVA